MSDRYTYDDDGKIDEIVAMGADVHLERLNGRDWYLIISKGESRIHLNMQRVVEFERYPPPTDRGCV